MGLGGAAIRVIPYLTTLEVLTALVFIAMLIVIAVILGKIKTAIEEQTELTRRIASRQDDIYDRAIKAEKAKAMLDTPSKIKTKPEDLPKGVREGYEEFGEMTEEEWEMARIYGPSTVRQLRDKKTG
jgi:hypothetical protein